MMKTSKSLLITSLIMPVLFVACDLPGGQTSARTAAKAADCSAVAANDGLGAGDAASHGTPQRTESEVVIGRDGSAVTATQTVSLRNDFGGAAAAAVTLRAINGSIETCRREGGGYHILATLEGRGSNEDQARKALADWQVLHEDNLGNGALSLSTRITPRNDSINGSASILAGLPVAASYAFDHLTYNGMVVASGFSGREALLESENGDVELDGSWDRAVLDTGSGGVSVSGNYGGLEAHIENGPVDAVLETLRSFSADLVSTNGKVDVTLRPSSEAGYDLMAETVNGRASIEVEGTETTGEPTAVNVHKRSPDYEQRAVKVQVSGSSTNGDVSIHQ